MRKKRILVHSEASYLNTGYANYGKEVISRLLDTGKYEVAEFSNYGAADDPRRKTIPWKNYPVAPCKSDKEDLHQLYSSNSIHQFGAWRFERACLDFKPDYFLSQMDPWMESWVKHSPFRKLFSWGWASTVDAMPQNPEWIQQFASTDYFYTLSDWAKDIVVSQGGKSINYMGSVSHCVPPLFKPTLNKLAHRISMGINPEWKIIGTVMRNQRRKLFPDLFEAFGKYLREYKDSNLYLYCHTSYPDNGWDIPQLMTRHGVASRVLFTYACDNCHALTIGKFSDALKQCKNCKNFSAKLSNVSKGASTEELVKIYQLFDLYFQCANSEGMGMPALEAAACGIPVMSVDYSAMGDIVRKVSGYPVPVKALPMELETGCLRAIPDQDAVIRYWNDFFSASESIRQNISKRTVQSYHQNYSWNRVIDSWMKSIDHCPFANWDAPIRQINIPSEDKIPNFPNNKQLVDWAISTYLPYSDMFNSFEANCLLRDLNFQSYRPNPCGYFYSESSYFDRVNYVPFTKVDLINMVKGKADIFNFWEKARVGQITFQQENWIDLDNL